MAFHGHTKIELHNVKTGENKVIEKHNIFTNYLHDVMQIPDIPTHTNWIGFLKRSWRYGNVQWNDQNNANGGSPRMVDILCGGILCLANEHEENPDNYFLTSDDIITARGANIANASEETQLGSYNSALEKSSDTSKTMVWDFAQNQGNGTISTIGLTNIGMALCGLGGTPSNMTHTTTNPFGDICLAKTAIGNIVGTYDDDYPTSDPCYFTPIYCSFKNSTLVSFLGFDSNVLHLRYYNMNCNTINPLLPTNHRIYNFFDFAVLGLTNGVRYSATKRVTFDLSNYTFAGTSYTNLIVTNDGIMYICPTKSNSLKSNETMEFIKIDLMKQKILGTCTITNTTGVTLSTSGWSFTSKTKTHDTSCPQHQYHNISKGYMLFRTSSTPYRTFAINLENSTDVKEILKENGEPYSLTACHHNFAGMPLCTIGNNVTSYMVDVDKGIAHCVRTGSPSGEQFYTHNTYTQYTMIPIVSDSELLNVWFGTKGHSYMRYYQDMILLVAYKQDTLSTINVLDEPVIKTADMTMRITYTISLEEDEVEE